MIEPNDIPELWYTTKSGRKKVINFTGETKEDAIIQGIAFVARNYKNITPTAGSGYLLKAYRQFVNEATT